MNGTTSDNGGTRTRLLEAASRLLAERGMHVPIRDILEAAGQRNASAVHYHFGGREGLLGALIEHHLATVEAERARLLETADLSEAPDLRTSIGLVVTPLASALLTDGGRDFLRILEHLANEQPGPGIVDWVRTLGPSWDLSIDYAVRAIDLPPDILQSRVAASANLVAAVLTARARDLAAGRTVPLPEHDVFVADLVEMVRAVLCAPVPRAIA